MKHIPSFQHPVLPAVLFLFLGAASLHAEEPEKNAASAIETADPFTKDKAASPPQNRAKEPTAEALDLQAHAAFNQGDFDKAIMLQRQAVTKATETLQSYSQSLSQYEGKVPAEAIARKLRTFTVPSINFEDTTLDEAVAYLRARSIDLDTKETDPTKKGVNFVIQKAPGNGSSTTSKNDTIKALRLSNVPLQIALKYICDATRRTFKIDGNAVTLAPLEPEDN
ncbi:MAG: hypothetical protein QM755_24135 [Luteolibacter sp.]